MPTSPKPPKTRYKLTLTIRGNTLEEIESELLTQTRGAFLLDSDYHERNEWASYSGRVTSRMEHQNPDMTPERYAAELHEWSGLRKAARKEDDDA